MLSEKQLNSANDTLCVSKNFRSIICRELWVYWVHYPLVKSSPLINYSFIFLGDIPPTGQAFFWMQYFPCQVSDGFAVYNDTKKHYESQNVIFQRLFPRSEESGLYPMDEMGGLHLHLF